MPRAIVILFSAAIQSIRHLSALANTCTMPSESKDERTHIQRAQDTGPVADSTETEDRDQGEEQQSLVSYSRGEMYMGPLPPPSMLKAFDDIAAGSAERIIKMAERDQESVIESIRRSDKRELISLYGAIGLAALGMILGAILLVQGKNIAGFVALLGPLGALIGTAIFKVRSEKKVSERDSN